MQCGQTVMTAPTFFSLRDVSANRRAPEPCNRCAMECVMTRGGLASMDWVGDIRTGIVPAIKKPMPPGMTVGPVLYAESIQGHVRIASATLSSSDEARVVSVYTTLLQLNSFRIQFQSMNGAQQGRWVHCAWLIDKQSSLPCIPFFNAKWPALLLRLLHVGVRFKS